MANRAAHLRLYPGAKGELESLVCSTTTLPRVARKCNIILLAGEGVTHSAIARRLKVSRPTVIATVAAFARDGVSALMARQPRSRTQLTLAEACKAAILTIAKSAPEGKEWTVRSLAHHLGLSRMLVFRVLQQAGVRLHRTRITLSTHPGFDQRVRAIYGLYVNPPYRALLLLVGQRRRSVIDNLPSLQASRPHRSKGDLTRVKRPDTTAEYGAFTEMHLRLTKCQPSAKNPRDFVAFLQHVATNAPKQLLLHVIVQSEASHDSTLLEGWINRHQSPQVRITELPSLQTWLDYVAHFLNVRHTVTMSAPNGKLLITALYDWQIRFFEKVTPFFWCAC
jgi:transposase